MTQPAVLSKLTKLPKKTLAIIAGAVIGLIFLLATVAFFSANTAGKKAAVYQKDLNTYVNRLANSNRSLKDVGPIAAKPPTLPSLPFGSLNKDYKNASAKQAMLDVFQDEILTPISKADFNSKFNLETVKAEKAYNTAFNEKTEEPLAAVGDTKNEANFKDFKKATISLLSNKLNATKDYRKNIAKLEAGAYGDRLKQFYLDQIDGSTSVYQSALNKAKSATTFGQVRYILTSHQTSSELPPASVGYPLLATNTFYASPTSITDPAITALQKSLQEFSATNPGEARLAAYRSLYGYMAVVNTPRDTDNELATLQQLSVSYYAIQRLEKLLGQDRALPKAGLDQALSRLRTAKEAISNIPFGQTASEYPGGLARGLQHYSNISALAEYNGYSDSLTNLRTIANNTGQQTIPNSSLDVAYGKQVVASLNHFLPGGYFDPEAAQYKRAVVACTNARLEFHEKSGAIIAQQTATAKKVNELNKRLAPLAAKTSPTAKDTKTLNDFRSKIQAANSEFEKLEKQKPALSTTQSNKLRDCQPATENALIAIKSKAENRAAQYEHFSTAARAIYR